MYSTELDFLKKTLKNAYEAFSKTEYTVSDKGEFDVVTNVDRGIENFVAQEIRRLFPRDLIHGEEFSSKTPLRNRTWILDPIDGTYNFSTGSPHFALQGAFYDQGQIQASVIYLPRFEMLLEAQRGKGAYCNGKKISVSDREPKQCIVSFGDFPHHRPDDARNQKLIFSRAITEIARVRMFGAASVDFAYLALGITDGTVVLTTNKYDLAPGLLLAEEAGAKLFGPNGEVYDFSCRGVIAVNQANLFHTICDGLEITYDSGQ